MADETIPQMRERIEKLNSENRELSSNLRRFEARETFREAGLKPEHGDLFAAQAGSDTEITVDTAKAFAEQFGLTAGTTDKSETQEAEEGRPESDTPAEGTELASMSSGGSIPGEGGAASTGNRMTRQEWVELSKTDPAAAQRALMGGRVQLRDDNFYVKTGQVRNG